MQNDLQRMFRKVLLFDCIIAVIFMGITQWVFKGYSLIILLGLFIGFVNFIINGTITEYTLLKKTKKYRFVALIGFISRVAIVCGIALILFKYNKFNVIAYMLGYSSQFVSLILYGIYIKDE